MALVIGLVVILLMTILAIVIVQLVNGQSRMADSARDQALAFQAAEAALRGAESRIAAGGAPFDPFDADAFSVACIRGNCRSSAAATPVWLSANWNSDSSTTQSFALSVPPGVPAPRYLIELLGGGTDFDVSTGCAPVSLRITARGFGPDGASADLQSVYRLRPDSC